MLPALKLLFERRVDIYRTLSLIGYKKIVPKVNIQISPVWAVVVQVNAVFCKVGNSII